MKIIILGAGQVGSSLAATLVNEGHDIVLVDICADQLQEYADRLDIRTVQGRCSYPGVLRQAGADEADMIIAVTDSDEVNMVACQVAYSLFHIPTKIARIRSGHYFIRKELFGQDNLPIDVFISPENLITENIRQQLAHPGTLEAIGFSNDCLKLIVIRANTGGRCVHQSLRQLNETIDASKTNIIAIFRRGKNVELTDDLVIYPDDEIYCVAKPDSIDTVIVQLRSKEPAYKNIMIAGGGNLGATLAKQLKQQQYAIKLIDHNREQCKLLAESLQGVTVLCAEASDECLLTSENIDKTDLFIAVTNDDETNILSAIHAKRLGCRSVMSLINRRAYVDIIEGGEIDHVISPQNASIGSIITHVRQGDVVQVQSLRRGAAEVIEAVAHGDRKTSRVTGRSLSQIKLPPKTHICGVIRAGKPHLPNTDLIIEPEDHILLLVLDKDYVREIERLFRVSASFF